MEILTYIEAHWVEWLFAAVIALLGLGYRNISARLRIEQAKNHAIAEGVQSLLRESLVENYNKYSDRGYCPIYAKESIKKVYTASYLASEVVKKMNYENLSEISPSDISNYYDIPEGVVTDSAMFVSTRSDSYTEIACFKLKSNESEKQLTKSIDNYISAKKKTYQNVDDKAYAVVSAAKSVHSSRLYPIQVRQAHKTL